MSKCKLHGIMLCLYMAFVISVHAQTSCTNEIIAAINIVSDACSSLGRNEMCYGHNTVIATSHDADDSFEFETVGDVVDVADVHTIELSEMDLDANSWGITLLRIQANIPDTIPGENVAMVLFGDVDLQNTGHTFSPLVMTSTAHANVRERPVSDGRVVAGLSPADTVQATGRVEDGSWIRIQLEDGAASGWVWHELLTTNGDITTLEIVASGQPEYGPIQAFTFRSGITALDCDAAPDSGILVQTPEGVGTITIEVNKVVIHIGSTLYMQADSSGELIIYVLEGSATVSSDGVTQFVPAGALNRVPLDANLIAIGSPSFPEPYDIEPLERLPLSLLEDEITIAPALTETEITDAVEAETSTTSSSNTGTVQIVSGNWTITETIISQSNPDCDVSDNLVFNIPIIPNEDFSLLNFPNFSGVGMTLSRTSGSTYAGNFAANRSFVLTFTSPTTFVGEVQSLSGNWVCVNNVMRWNWQGVAN